MTKLFTIVLMAGSFLYADRGFFSINPAGFYHLVHKDQYILSPVLKIHDLTKICELRLAGKYEYDTGSSPHEEYNYSVSSKVTIGRYFHTGGVRYDHSRGEHTYWLDAGRRWDHVHIAAGYCLSKTETKFQMATLKLDFPIHKKKVKRKTVQEILFQFHCRSAFIPARAFEWWTQGEVVFHNIGIRVQLDYQDEFLEYEIEPILKIYF